MKPNLFKYSVLTAGIVGAMGISGTANADSVTYDKDNAFAVKNVATASYTVAGNNTRQTAESNEVTINVTETGQFSLIATSDTDNDVNTNSGVVINPQTGATAEFTHTLSNDGNVTDTYTLNLRNEAGDDFDYDISASTISYQIVDADGNNVGSPVNINNGGTIQLAPGQRANLVVTAPVANNTERAINDNGVLTVTATSRYLTDNGQTATATNTDTAITTTPIYAITKSARSNLGTRVIDLNNPNAYVDYTITVRNEGNADGTDVNIIDALPNGLVAIQPNEANYVAPTTTGGSSNQTPTISADGRTITVTGQDIAQDQTITVTFRAKRSANAAVGSDFTNYAVVEDDVDGDGTIDLVDSSGDAADTNTNENNYEGNTGLGVDNNTNATVTPSNQNRDIDIVGGGEKEVALQSQNNGYTFTISNNGEDIVEAAQTGQVLFTVTPTDDINEIDITTVFVDVDGDGVLDTADGDRVLTATNGRYDLNDADANGLAVGESVNISVLVDTNGSGSRNNAAQTNDIGKFEAFTVTVLPQGEVDGTPAPAGDIVADATTTMQGVDLLKYQAAAACGTTPTSITDWVTTNVTATADQCAFYRLEATNTFSNTQVTNIVLQDTLENTLTYQNNFASTTSNNSSAATESTSGQTVGGTFNTLTGGEVGNIYFSAAISQTGTNTTP